MLIFDLIWIMDWGNLFLPLVFAVHHIWKDITSSSNVNAERHLSMILLMMNQWSKKRLFAYVCAHTQLMFFFITIAIHLQFFFSYPSEKWLRPSIIWVIFYHFTWVNFHQLIKKDYFLDISSRFFLIMHHFEEMKKKVMSYSNFISFQFTFHMMRIILWSRCEDDKMYNFNNQLFFLYASSFLGTWFCYWWKRFSCNLVKDDKIHGMEKMLWL